MKRRPLLAKKQKEAALRHMRDILSTPLPEEDRSPVRQSVHLARERRDLLLRAAERVGTPCYVLSEGDLDYERTPVVSGSSVEDLEEYEERARRLRKEIRE